MITETSTIAEQFDRLLAILKNPKFLAAEGLGNEVPIFIYPYLPEREFEFQSMVPQLKYQLELAGVRVLEINLYDLCIEILKQEGLFDALIEVEPETDKFELEQNLAGPLGAQDKIVPAIRQRMERSNYDILILWGAGQVFPYLRTHSILNNMQVAIRERPLVLFYPGTYMQNIDGRAELKLFNRLPSYGYYREFNLLKFEL